VSGGVQPSKGEAAVRDEDFFWEGAQQGRLLAQRCGDCGLLRHPPSPMCQRCQSLQVELVECSGRGKVLTWLLSKHPTRPDAPSRIVVRLELEEGLFLIANLESAEFSDITAGLPVEVFFQAVVGVVVPCCRPVLEAAA
jgi:uncharacterized OB-fold protein